MNKTVFSSLFCLILLVGFGREAVAQDRIGQFFKDTAKDVVLDPTTYVPAGLYIAAKKLDWNSSQVFFRNGYVEANPDYTISGKVNDVPISYSAGNRRMIVKALPVLELSLLNNAGASISGKVLTHFYPNHKKLIKSICWIEKIAAASYISYNNSVLSFNQWKINKRVALELGFK